MGASVRASEIEIEIADALAFFFCGRFDVLSFIDRNEPQMELSIW